MSMIRRTLGSKLHRKFLRDLSRSKGLFIAVAVVIFLGVALFAASFLGYRNLSASYEYSYDALRMADFTVEVVEAPPQAVDELRSFEGIEAVTGRANMDIPVTLPGQEGVTVLARVISLPSGRQPDVNRVKVEQGSYFAAAQAHAVLVEKSFAEYHDLAPGDAVTLSIGGSRTEFTVAGVVTSPEYIWPAKSRQEILVSAENFGVLFIAESTLAELKGEDVLNEFCFVAAEGADRDSVVNKVEEALAHYQVVDVVPLEEQPSNAALKLDLQEFGEMAEVFPLLFLIVGALATYILLSRIVQNQRTQIGLMRAMGYTRRQVLAHYLSFALVIGVTGSVTGMVAGYLLAGAVTTLYVDILGLPFTHTRMGMVEWLAVGEGVLVGILPCLIAGIIPAYAASRLAPAEAMRTPPPAAGRRPLVERILPFLGRLSFMWKIPLRNIFRNRRRSLYAITGVAFGVTLIMVSASFIDSFDALFSLQFNKIQTSDAQVNFAEPQTVALADEARNWEGVSRAEPVLELPCRLTHGDRSYSTLVIGLRPESELCGLYLVSGERSRASGDGILLSEGLRKTLDLRAGDTVEVVMPAEGAQEFPVRGFVKQPMGSYGYLTLSQAQSLAGGQAVISGLMLEASSDDLSSIREQASALPGHPSVEITQEIGQKVDEMMGLLRGIMYVMLGFGVALSLAIVFTTVTIGILERRREIATMRTLGDTRRRIAAMITIENLVLGIAGIIPGIPLAYGVAILLMGLFRTDMMNFYLAVYPRTYVMTVAIVILIMLVSQLPALRNLARMDLPGVIKEQVT